MENERLYLQLKKIAIKPLITSKMYMITFNIFVNVVKFVLSVTGRGVCGVCVWEKECFGGGGGGGRERERERGVSQASKTFQSSDPEECQNLINMGSNP